MTTTAPAPGQRVGAQSAAGFPKETSHRQSLRGHHLLGGAGPGEHPLPLSRALLGSIGVSPLLLHLAQRLSVLPLPSGSAGAGVGTARPTSPPALSCMLRGRFSC